jgi:cyclase
VTSKGVVMIDSPQLPSDASIWSKEIAKHGLVRYLINTEPHRDHFTTNCLFDGTVVGHEGTRDAILASSINEIREFVVLNDPGSSGVLNDLVLKAPTITLSQRLTLHVGDRTFRIISFPGHTPFQVAVFVPEERVLFTSDNVFCKVQAWMHQSLPFEWLAALREMRKLDADVLVPGHGQICTPAYLDEMADFLQSWIDAVRQAIDNGMSVEEAQERISFLEKYPMGMGAEELGPQVQRWNVARLYEVLKKRGCSERSTADGASDGRC